MEMTLARALRYSKRVKEQISKVETDIATYNSVMEGSEREIEGTIADALIRRAKLVDHLIEIKLATQKATMSVMPIILRLSELKGEIAFYNRIGMTHGLVNDRYGTNTPTKYVAEIRKADKDRKVAELQAQIDELQGKVDAHNANTKISVTDVALNVNTVG